MKLDLSTVAYSLDKPYKVRVFDNVIPAELWDVLADRFPDDKLLQPGPSIGYKINLNYKNHKDYYLDFLSKEPEWASLEKAITGGFGDICSRAFSQPMGSGRRLNFEFSGLLGDGGHLRPHTDTKKKRATMVMHFNKDWDNAWGGQFEVLRHKTDPDGDHTLSKLVWDDVETLLSVPVIPNRAVFMQRTRNSLHCVRPINAPTTRRSITVNLIR